MKQRTIRDILIDGLKAKGWQEFPSSSQKYAEFHCSGYAGHLFVGKRGALRCGRNVSNSYSLEDSAILREFMEAGRSLP